MLPTKAAVFSVPVLFAAASFAPATTVVLQDPTASARAQPADMESAVNAGLAWLVRQQESDGHWSLQASAKHCPSAFDPKRADRADYDVGLTGLAVLAFSRARAAQGGSTTLDANAALEKGVSWMIASQQLDGAIGEKRAFMYAQAVSTRALVAAYMISRDAKVRDAAQKAVTFVQQAQRPSPTGKGMWGWRYSSRQDVEKASPDGVPNAELYDSDISITAWCAGALRAARNAGLKVEDASLEGAEEFAKWATARSGNVGYLDPKTAGATVQGVNDHFQYHPTVMNALGTLVRLDAGEQPGDNPIALSMKGVLADAPAVSADHLSIDYYFWHHGVIALRRTGASGGEAWTALAVGHLLALQDKSANDCTRGAWITGDRWSYAGGPLYMTGINVLTLEDALGWK